MAPLNPKVVQGDSAGLGKNGLPLARKTAPLVIKKKPLPPSGTAADLDGKPDAVSGAKGSAPSTPRKKISKGPSPTASRAASSIPGNVPFRVVKPSLETLEKAMSIALFFEQYYHSLLRPQLRPHSTTTTPGVHAGNYVLNRARRLAQLEATFALPENRFMSEAEKEIRREELIKEENMILRERRRRVDVKAFEMGRVIGHGAFGVVKIARERQSGRLVAIKQLRKVE